MDTSSFYPEPTDGHEASLKSEKERGVSEGYSARIHPFSACNRKLDRKGLGPHLQIWGLHAYHLALVLPSWLLSRFAPVLLPRQWAEVRARVEREQGTGHPGIEARVDAILLEMLICGEDRRFLNHCGFDPMAMLRALFWTLRGRRQGASTIEQQLVRTITGEKRISLVRKFREVLLASCVAHTFPKTTSARAYLGIGFFGTGLDGLARATASIPCPEPKQGLAMTQLWAAGMISRLKHPEPARASKRWKAAHARRTQYILAVHARLERAGRFAELTRKRCLEGHESWPR